MIIMLEDSPWTIFLEDLLLHLKSGQSLLWEMRNELGFSLARAMGLLKVLCSTGLGLFSEASISVQISLLLLLFWSLVFLAVKGYLSLSKVSCSCGSMEGRTVVITGGDSGEGYEMVRELVSRDARVIMGCKSLKAGISACKEIVRLTGKSDILVRKLDLSSLESVRFFSECVLQEEGRLDVLVLQENTFLSKKYLTEDNLELIMAANYFGHFLLTHLLYPLLLRSGENSPSRIVIGLHSSYKWGGLQLNNLNSEFSFEDSKAFSDSQRAKYYMGRELNRRFRSRPILVNCFASRRVRVGPNERAPTSRQQRDVIPQAFRLYFDYSPKEASQAGIHLCVSEAIGRGKIYRDCRTECEFGENAKEDASAVQLMNKTLGILEELSYV